MRMRTLQYSAEEHVGTVKVGDELGAAANLFLGLDLRRRFADPEIDRLAHATTFHPNASAALSTASTIFL